MLPGVPLNRRFFLLGSAAALTSVATPALAGFEDEVKRQLKAQGYKQITVSNTLLGRSKIVGKRKGGTREIILNPRTGEILRDLWTSADGSVSAPSLVDKDDDDSKDDSGDDGDDDGGDDDGGDDGGEDGGGDDGGGDDGGGDDNSGKGDGGEDGKDD